MRLALSLALVLATPVSAQQLRFVQALRFGGDELSIIGAMAYTTTSVYVFDNMAQQILEYDRAGKLVRKLGRSGEGPGEYAHVGSMGFLGDTLWTSDPGNNRVELVLERKPIESMPRFVQAPPTGKSLPTASIRWLLVGGYAAAQLEAPLDVEVTEGAITDLPLYRVSREGVVTGKLPSVDSRHRTMVIRPPGVPSSGAGRYTRQPLFDGDVVAATMTGTALYRLNLATYTLEKFAPTGQLLWTYKGRFARRQTNRDEVLDSVVRPWKESYARFGASSPAMLRSMVESGMYFPKYTPPVIALATGRDGTVWVQYFRLGLADATWDVISSDGELLGAVRVPGDVVVTAVERDEYWGYVLDEDNVPSVVRYRRDW